MSGLPAAVALACIAFPINDPLANPYRIDYAIMLVLLVVGYLAWKHIQPPALPRLRCCAVVAVTVAQLATCAQTTLIMGGATGPLALLILESTAALTMVVYLELVLAMRREPTIPPARVVHGAERLAGTSRQ